MAKVGKTAGGTPHVNKVVLRTVVVQFQRTPGTSGTNAERAIADVSYKLKVDDRLAPPGKTAADGTVTLHIPTGANAILEIFDTEYAIKILGALDAVTDPDGRQRRQQRRLQLLGYELGTVDGDKGPSTNRATLMFQADNALNTDGNIGSLTHNQLKTQFGE